ncbi:MAG TPA: alpha/beta hydrolase [Acidimicrobiales bacterium]|nr:alpha/beta hydrolase [Acidimicrobiales bacterium]
MPSFSSRRLALALVIAAAAAAGGRVGLHQSAAAIRRRSDPALDPLYDLSADVVRHDVPAADGGSIHVIERGTGRPLLLIHGITLQARIWAPQLHLMADRYRVLAMDVRGHGRSTAGSEGFGRRIAARDVATVLDHFDLRDAIVVGHSMGGMILMEFAADFAEELQERVAGLVFMDTAAYQIAPKPVLPLAKALGRRARVRLEAGRAVPRLPMGEDDLSWVLSRLAFGARPSARAVDEVRRCGMEVPQSTSLPSGIDLLDHDAREALAATHTPSMVMVGSRDLLTPVYAARRIAGFLPMGRFEVLPGAGHQLMQERPHEVARLLDDFVARLGTGVSAPVS